MKAVIKRHALTVTALIIPVFILISCQKEIRSSEEEADTGEFFSLTVDGMKHVWHINPYHLYAMEDSSDHGIGYYYNMVGAYDTVVWSRSIQLVILRPANGPATPPFNFDIESVIVEDQSAPPIMQGNFYPLFVSQTTVTEFGPVGGYISGSFSGTYIKSTIAVPTDTATVSCSWRVKREPF